MYVHKPMRFCTYIPHTQIAGGLAKRLHPLEATGGVPSPGGPPSTPALPTKLLHKLIPAPCRTSHCINPCPVQWAVGPQRALCCPPLPQGDHLPAAGNQSKLKSALGQTPHIRVLGPAHTPGTETVHIASLVLRQNTLHF